MALAVNKTKPEQELKDDPKDVETVDTKDVDTAGEAEHVHEGELLGAEHAGTDAGAADDAPAADSSGVTVEDQLNHEPEGDQAQPATSDVTDVVVREEGSMQLALTGDAASNFFAQMIKELQEEGQEGLDMSFGVFPLVSLDKGEFKVGDDDFGDSGFTGVPLMSRPKYAYRTTKVSEKDAEVLFADSDQAHLQPDSLVSERLREWKEKWPESGYEVRAYQDVFLYMVNCQDKPELEGQLVQLSVAPTSVKLYTRACLKAKGRGYKAHECVFKIGVGEKIRGEFDYYPWSFEAIGSCQRLGVEVKFGQVKDENW